jgi:hypothetical protein
MLYKNIKHASSADIEVINEIKDVKFGDNHNYFLIAKKDKLFIVQSKDGFNLIVDSNIVDILKEKDLLGGIK